MRYSVVPRNHLQPSTAPGSQEKSMRATIDEAHNGSRKTPLPQSILADILFVFATEQPIC